MVCGVEGVGVDAEGREGVFVRLWPGREGVRGVGYGENVVNDRIEKVGEGLTSDESFGLPGPRWRLFYRQ